MSESDQSKEQLIQELESFRREVALLKIKQKAFDTQDELCKSLMAMQQAATGSVMLKGILQKIIKVCNQLTNAEESSLFLLDDNGVVTESILARGATIREEKQTVIGQVLDQGLAGWVSRNRQFGLITDTKTDERWLTFSNQPYRVRSALCVPIFMGKSLLAIMTLMHSQPNHFQSESVNLLQMIVNQIALVIDKAQSGVERQQAKPEIKINDRQIEPSYSKQPSGIEPDELAQLGIYMITADAKFLYMNSRLVEIFGYRFSEFVILESLFNLVVPEEREQVKEAINQCIEGMSKNLSFQFKGQQKNGHLIDLKIYGAKTNFYGKPVAIGVLKLLEAGK